jgi:hypothetical protein
MMKRFVFGNRITPILLVTCGLLVIIVAIERHSLLRQASEAPAADTQSETPTDRELTRSTYLAPDFETFSEILDRPLFTEGRTPPPEPSDADETVATPQQKQTRLNLRLEGIALTPDARVAVIRDLSSKKLFRIAEGEQHEGWTVENIHAMGATLKLGEQTEELTLELDDKKAGKTATPFRGNLNRRNK